MKKTILIAIFVLLGIICLGADRGRYKGKISVGEATYIVAASDAPSHIKKKADFVCDGTADEVEIQAAIDKAVSHNNFGIIALSEGSFNIAATIYHCGTPAHLAGGVGTAPTVWIRGSGVNSTQLHLRADVDMFTFGRREQTIFSGISDLKAVGHTSDRASGSFMHYIFEGTGGTDVDLLFDFNMRNIFIQDFRDSGVIVEEQSWGWILDNVIIEFCGRHVRPSDGITPGVTSQTPDNAYVQLSDGGFSQWKLTGHTFSVGDEIAIKGATGAQGLKMNGFWTVRAIDTDLLTISQSFGAHTQSGTEAIVSGFSHGMIVKNCAFAPKFNACKFISNEGCGLFLSDGTNKALVYGSEFDGVAESTPGIAIMGGRSNVINGNRFTMSSLDGITQAVGLLSGPFGTTDTQLNLMNNNVFEPTKTTDQSCMSIDRSSFFSNILGNTFNTSGSPTTTVDLRITGSATTLHASIKTGNSNSTKFTSILNNEAGGLASAISTGGTIAHGLAATPTKISVVPATAGVSDLNISVDGTNITVTFAGGGSENFYWTAQIR